MEFGVKVVFDASDSRFVAVGDKDIIHIERHNGIFLGIYEYTFIGLNGVEIEFLYIFRKVLVLNSGRLL